MARIDRQTGRVGNMTNTMTRLWGSLLIGLAWPASVQGGQGALDRPTQPEALEQHANADAEFSGPRGHGLRLPVERQLAFESDIFNWRGQSFLNRPAQIEAPIQRGNRHAAVPARPLSNGHSTATECQEAIVAPVSSLFQSSGPPTIRRLIGSVVVIALDRMEWRRARPHVGEECLERLPSVAHRDAAATVVLIVLGSWVRDTDFHFPPNAVLGSVGARHD